MKVLVTGAFGMLAHAVLPALKRAEHEVYALAQNERDYFYLQDLHHFSSPRLSDKYADILNAGVLTNAAKAFRPNWILNLAAFTDVDQCESSPDLAFLVNGLGARNVAIAAEASGSSLLTVSTDYVFDGRSKLPYREYDQMAPLSVYGRSKMAGESAVRELCARHLIVRTSWLFGAGGRNFVDSIIRRMSSGEGLRVVNDQRGCPTYTEDLARGLVELIEKNQFGTFHVCGQDEATWFDLAEGILQQFKSDVPLVPIESSELDRPARRPAYSVLDTTWFRQVSGSPLMGWREALRRYLEEYFSPHRRDHQNG